MKSPINPESSEKILLAAGLVHLVWGLFIVLFPKAIFLIFNIEVPELLEFWQIFGLFSALFGVGYLIARIDSAIHWPIILIGLFSKILTALILIKGFFGDQIALQFLEVVLIVDLIWVIPFYYLIIYAYESNTLEESAPKKFNDLIKFVRTNRGETLYEMSEKENILLVFVRHFGCTFCRETVSEIAKLEKSIQGKKLTPVFVHMSDPAFGDQFFAQYYTHPVSHISDPQRFLYKSLDLKRGSLGQLFGPKVWIRGLWAGIFKGHGIGATEGDYLQLGGYFILSRGQIVFEHKTRAAAEFFELEILPEA